MNIHSLKIGAIFVVVCLMSAAHAQTGSSTPTPSSELTSPAKKPKVRTNATGCELQPDSEGCMGRVIIDGERVRVFDFVVDAILFDDGSANYCQGGSCVEVGGDGSSSPGILLRLAEWSSGVNDTNLKACESAAASGALGKSAQQAARTTTSLSSADDKLNAAKTIWNASIDKPQIVRKLTSVGSWDAKYVYGSQKYARVQINWADGGADYFAFVFNGGSEGELSNDAPGVGPITIADGVSKCPMPQE